MLERRAMKERRLLVRELEAEDLPFLFELWHIPEVMRYADELPSLRGWSKSDDATTAWVRHQERRAALGPSYAQLILCLTDGTRSGTQSRDPPTPSQGLRGPGKAGISGCASHRARDGVGRGDRLPTTPPVLGRGGTGGTRAIGESFFAPVPDSFTLDEWAKPQDVDTLIGDVKLRPEHWGRGLGTEGMRCVVAWLFGRTGCRLLVVPPHYDNPAAVRVYEKAGFVHTAETRSWRGHRIMELWRERYEAIGRLGGEQDGIP